MQRGKQTEHDDLKKQIQSFINHNPHLLTKEEKNPGATCKTIAEALEKNKRYPEAIYWYQQGIKAGNLYCSWNLGIFYTFETPYKNNEEAIRLLRDSWKKWDNDHIKTKSEHRQDIIDKLNALKQNHVSARIALIEIYFACYSQEGRNKEDLTRLKNELNELPRDVLLTMIDNALQQTPGDLNLEFLVLLTEQMVRLAPDSSEPYQTILKKLTDLYASLTPKVFSDAMSDFEKKLVDCYLSHISTNSIKQIERLSHLPHSRKNRNLSAHALEQFGFINIANLFEKANDYSNAFYWLQKGVAENKDVNATQKLASYFHHGLGTDINLDKSVELYFQAARHGNEEAISALHTLKLSPVSVKATLTLCQLSLLEVRKKSSIFSIITIETLANQLMTLKDKNLTTSQQQEYDQLVAALTQHCLNLHDDKAPCSLFNLRNLVSALHEGNNDFEALHWYRSMLIQSDTRKEAIEKIQTLSQSSKLRSTQDSKETKICEQASFAAELIVCDELLKSQRSNMFDHLTRAALVLNQALTFNVEKYFNASHAFKFLKSRFESYRRAINLRYGKNPDFILAAQQFSELAKSPTENAVQIYYSAHCYSCAGEAFEKSNHIFSAIDSYLNAKSVIEDSKADPAQTDVALRALSPKLEEQLASKAELKPQETMTLIQYAAQQKDEKSNQYLRRAFDEVIKNGAQKDISMLEKLFEVASQNNKELAHQIHQQLLIEPKISLTKKLEYRIDKTSPRLECIKVLATNIHKCDGLVAILQQHAKNPEPALQPIYFAAVDEWLKKCNRADFIATLPDKDRIELFKVLKEQDNAFAHHARETLLKYWHQTPSLLGDIFSRELSTDPVRDITLLGKILFKLSSVTDQEIKSIERIYNRSIDDVRVNVFYRAIAGYRDERYKTIVEAIYTNVMIFDAANKGSLNEFVQQDHLLALIQFIDQAKKVPLNEEITLNLKILLHTLDAIEAEKRFQIPREKILEARKNALMQISLLATEENPSQAYAQFALNLINKPVIMEIMRDRTLHSDTVITAALLQDDKQLLPAYLKTIHNIYGMDATDRYRVKEIQRRMNGTVNTEKNISVSSHWATLHTTPDTRETLESKSITLSANGIK